MGTSTCSGRCCESFHLPRVKDLAALKEMASEAKIDGRPHAEDLQTIADMVIPLFTETKHGQTTQFFGCRHFDKTTRLCQIYDKRPQLCRDYPNYGASCGHSAGCSYRHNS